MGALRRDIQGLRAIAVIAVIIFHINKDWLPGGFVGVDIFFVISGYLIASILIREKESGLFSFFKFYQSRILRILPVYIFILGIIFIISIVIMTPNDYRYFEESFRSALKFDSNRYYAKFGNYFAPESYEWPLLHTWSISIEIQFYLILPFIIYLFNNKNLKVFFIITTLCLTSLSSYYLYFEAKKSIYYALYARIPEFMFGSLVFLVLAEKQYFIIKSQYFSYCAVFLIAFSFIFVSEAIVFPGLVSVPACLGAAFYIYNKNSSLNNFFSHNIFVYIGDRSYSLYLWHWPILSIFRYYAGNYAIDPVAGLFLIILILAVSHLSHAHIEAPFRRRKNLWSAVMIGTVVAVSLALYLPKASDVNTSLVSPLAPERTRYAAPDSVCHSRIFGDCLRGSLSAKTDVLVIGDSHAAQLNLFFDEIGRASDFRFKVISGSSCVTFPGFDIERIPESSRESCREQIRVVEELLLSAPTVIIAGMWQYHAKSDAFLQAFEAFILSASQAGKKVIVLAQVPMMTSNVLRANRFENLGFPVHIALNPEWKKQNERIALVVARHATVKFLDLSLSELFMKVPFENGQLIYFDQHHLNEVGSVRYGKIATPTLRAMLLDP